MNKSLSFVYKNDVIRFIVFQQGQCCRFRKLLPVVFLKFFLIVGIARKQISLFCDTRHIFMECAHIVRTYGFRHIIEIIFQPVRKVGVEAEQSHPLSLSCKSFYGFYGQESLTCSSWSLNQASAIIIKLI